MNIEQMIEVSTSVILAREAATAINQPRRIFPAGRDITNNMSHTTESQENKHFDVKIVRYGVSLQKWYGTYIWDEHPF
jgi:hypothetical protein